MKIKNLKINSFGKINNQEYDFSEKINLIYGKNEAGKSTLLKFIHNIFYGTSKKALNNIIDDGNIIVKDIDVNGTENLKKILKDDVKVVTIFLRVPKEELRRRLQNRIDKPSAKEITLRLNRFDYEESKIGIYDYVIKNDNLEKSVQIIMTIIDNEYNLNK